MVSLFITRSVFNREFRLSFEGSNCVVCGSSWVWPLNQRPTQRWIWGLRAEALETRFRSLARHQKDHGDGREVELSFVTAHAELRKFV
ncbi:hypothetical protein AALP_AA2G037800 [Arabis alpina]|uniref:Uncharacterized protein n=1 Tax=Arabis alpina TaxID=50452 RepID=A0A087HF61_ARAAL|nr:hypothetical protein AALP_AA2G037800 [Arabis alpina]